MLTSGSACPGSACLSSRPVDQAFPASARELHVLDRRDPVLRCDHLVRCAIASQPFATTTGAEFGSSLSYFNAATCVGLVVTSRLTLPTVGITWPR